MSPWLDQGWGPSIGDGVCGTDNETNRLRHVKEEKEKTQTKRRNCKNPALAERGLSGECAQRVPAAAWGGERGGGRERKETAMSVMNAHNRHTRTLALL